MITLTIPGQPVGKGRPRASRRGAGIHLRTPERTANYEQWVALCASQAVGDEWMPLDRPVVVELVFVMRRPKRLCRKKDPDHRLASTNKPDLDNLCKSALDGLVLGGVLNDDTLVVQLAASKLYAAKGEQPHTYVEVTRWDDE